jgi:hypothetical protein
LNLGGGTSAASFSISSSGSPKSPNFASTLQTIRRWLANKENVEVKNPRVRCVNVKAEKASLDFDLAIRAVKTKTANPARGPRRIRMLHCVNNEKTWKIWREEAAQNVAKALHGQFDQSVDRPIASCFSLPPAEFSSLSAPTRAILSPAS